MKRFDKILTALLILLILSELFSSFLSDNWFFDIFVHYRLIRIVSVMVLINWLAFRRSLRAGLRAFVVVLAFCGGIYVVDRVRVSAEVAKSTDSIGHSTKIRIISFNVLTRNASKREVFHWLKSKIDPSIPNLIFVMEANREWIHELEALKKDLAFSFEFPREDNFGFVLFGNTTNSQIGDMRFDPSGVPAVTGVAKVLDKSFRFIGVHTLPPAGEREFKSRNIYFDNLRKFIDSSPLPTVVFGDLNCSPWSKNINRVLISSDPSGKSMLYSVDKKLIPSPTWFGLGWLFSVPIDYILHTPEFASTEFEVGPDLGSDHRPLVVTLQL